MLNEEIKQPNLDDYFVQKKIELLIDMNNKKIAKDMTRLAEMITALNEEVSSLRRKVNENRTAEFRAPPVAENPRPQVEERQSCLSANKEQQPQMRYGNFKSEDVSIEKFFSFSKKK